LASSGSFDCGRRDENAPAFAQDDEVSFAGDGSIFERASNEDAKEDEAMVDLTAVGEVMATVGPYLALLKGVGGKVLEGTETKLGEKALEFLTTRLTGKPAEALKAAKAEPDEMNLAMLQAAVEVVAKKDEGFLRELGALLQETGGGHRVSSVITGHLNEVTQIVGDGIRRGKG
jgi:thioredoxin-like negative regulator of GroEL